MEREDRTQKGFAAALKGSAGAPCADVSAWPGIITQFYEQLFWSADDPPQQQRERLTWLRVHGEGPDA